MYSYREDTRDLDLYRNKIYSIYHKALVEDRVFNQCYNELLRINIITPMYFIVSKQGELLETIYDYSENNKKSIQMLEDAIAHRKKELEEHYLKYLR